MTEEYCKYDLTKMQSNYTSAKSSIWDAWIEVRSRELKQKTGMTLELAVTCFADDIRARREMPTDEIIEKCIKDISEAQ